SVDESSAFAPNGRYGLQIDFECDPGRLDELLAATWEIVEDVRTRPFALGGVVSMREKNRRTRETGVRTNVFWAAGIAGALSRDEDPRALLTAEARDAALTPDAIRDAAVRWLDDSRVIQAVQRP
ncbi:MAG: hypothetical protein KC656_28045, partial [Myxococcales bacterium]|nr:hypothetical protein [Myxococcales bacterium]